MKSLLSTIGLATTLASTGAFAQGSLTPPGAPAPVMKSLQEIWDKLGALETQNSQLQTLTSKLEKQLTLLSASTVNFPWNISTVDQAGNVGQYTSLAFGPDDQPAIAYYDAGNGFLKIARYDGATWTASTVDNVGNVGQYASLAFGPDGQPAIAYYAATAGTLKIARFDGATWTVSTVDNAANVGQYASLVFGPDGQPAISYYDATSLDLKFARFDGTAWTVTLVDGPGNVGQYTSLKFGPNGQPAISYYESVSRTLKVARFDGSVWTASTVTGATANVGQHTSLAFGPDGQPAISYLDANATAFMKIARFNGTAWVSTTVGGVTSGSLGLLFSSLAFGPDGQPAVAYASDTGVGSNVELRSARFNGSAWTATLVDGVGSVGRFGSQAFGPDGQPTISYYDVTNGDLKFARKGIFKSAP
jgi:hypothetical protein